MGGKITVPELRARKASAGRGERIAMVTAYDATFARMLDAAGVDAMLIGDSLGMVIQGGTSTLPVTLDEIIYHGRAVARGTQRAHLIGDMPFMSYQTGLRDALANGGRMMKEGGFESLKLEGGREIADVVAALVRMGIPVLGHIGLMPQRVHAMGGFKVQGRTGEMAESILEDAIAIADAVMSLDNVVAIAAASDGNVALFTFGLVVSIPLIIMGSTLIMSLIARFPLFVWAGAGLLGWIGGEMIVTDPWIVARLGHGAGEWHLIGASVGAALVLAIAWTLRRSRRAQHPV